LSFQKKKKNWLSFQNVNRSSLLLQLGLGVLVIE
jgi:hypothetical protein